MLSAMCTSWTLCLPSDCSKFVRRSAVTQPITSFVIHCSNPVNHWPWLMTWPMTSHLRTCALWDMVFDWCPTMTLIHDSELDLWHDTPVHDVSLFIDESADVCIVLSFIQRQTVFLVPGLMLQQLLHQHGCLWWQEMRAKQWVCTIYRMTSVRSPHFPPMLGRGAVEHVQFPNPWGPVSSLTKPPVKKYQWNPCSGSSNSHGQLQLHGAECSSHSQFPPHSYMMSTTPRSPGWWRVRTHIIMNQAYTPGPCLSNLGRN